MVPRKNRFFGRRDPRIVLKYGKSLREGPFQLKYLINKSRADWRLAVIVSTKISKSAPVRNRIRRRVYETVRTNPPARQDIDMVLSAYDPRVAKLDQPHLETYLKRLLAKIN